MNINAINHMMINKNLKFRANEVPQEPQKPMGNSPEGTVTKPQDGMKALANNNIAFQGLNLGKVAEKMGPAARKTILPILGAAMLAPAVTSCSEPMFSVQQEVTVDINMKEFTDLFNKVLDMYQQMLDMQKINNEQMDSLLSYMNSLLEEARAGRISLDEMKQAVLEYIFNDQQMQENIYNQLVANGKTEEEAKETLDKVYDLMNAGKFDLAYDMLQQIIAELGEINESLDFIIEMLAQQAEQARDNAELEDARFNELTDMIAKLVEQGYDIEEILKNMDAKLARANDSLYKLGLNQEKIEAAIREIMAEHGDEITVGDLKAILGEQSAAWMAFFEAQMALQNDIINDNSAKVQDVLQGMNDKMVTKQVFNDQMNRLYDLLKKAQEQGLAESQKIQDLIAGLDFSCDCNCNCGDQIDNNEGILGDLDNIVNGNN